MDQISVDLKNGYKIYFASDFHLGAPNSEESRKRELLIIQWLEKIQSTAQVIVLAGDVFDFWYEYKHVAPKGHIRFLGKLADLSDKGIQIILFHGNHDMWMKSYLEEEIGLKIYGNPICLTAGNKDFYLGHGDGLGPGDYTYKLLRRVFRNKLAQWLFGWVHPTLAFGLATGWSSQSRIANLEKDDPYKGKEEWLFQFCEKTESIKHHDYYVFGHRHLPIDEPIGKNSRYINLGEWVTQRTFAEFDGTELHLRTFD